MAVPDAYAKKEIERAPQKIVEKLSIDLDSLSIGYDRLSHPNPNPNPNLNPKSNFKDLPEREPSTSYPEDVRKGMKQLVRKMRMDS